MNRRPAPGPGVDLPAQSLAGLLGDDDATRLFPGGPDGPAGSRDTAGTRRQRLAVRPRRGGPGRFGGRSPVLLRDSAHRASTAQAAGIYPFLHGAPLPPVGPHIGRDMHTGAAFSCHPVEWLHREIVSNTNLMVSGVPGSGKSALLKALAFRLMCFGIRTFIAGDLKNEYAPLARALGVDPLELGPGLTNRLNPLDSGPLGRSLPADRDGARQALDLITQRRISLLVSLLEMRLRRPVQTSEELALSLALRELTGEATAATRLVDPTLPELHALLRDPSAGMVTQMRVRGFTTAGTGDVAAREAATQELRELIRPVTDALATLLTGALAGIFDGPTRAHLDFDGPLQTVDLSRIQARGDDDSIAMTLSCVSSWAQAAIDVTGGPPRLVIRDEVWRQARVPAMLRKVDADLRLSRSTGTIQVLATHQLGDFNGVGAAGSAERALATELISKCAVRVLCPQDTGPLRELRETIGLSTAECDEIARWTGPGFRGWGLWQIDRGGSHVVKVELTDLERQLFHTNERMTV